MIFEEIKNEKLGESYYKTVHSSGLTIYVNPKVGYNSTYAIFGTNYGSVNTNFSVDGNETICVPDGTAHFLEHKMFENEDGDAFTKYAKTGASANAYTSFEKTCYLFSCTENFKESFEILLNFVQQPYFTKETVDKEQGIIAQEIKMYDDAPEWRVMFNLLECLYHNHPVKIDIAGTVESISQITAEKLYECYNSFYNLNNMVLCVSGNVTPQEVLEIANNNLKDEKKQTVSTLYPEEPQNIVKDYIEQQFPVAVPLFQLGFKENPEKGRTTAKEMALTDILLFAIASNSSTLYNNLIDKELINTTFSYEYLEGPEYRATIFSGESRNPKEVSKIIKEYITNIKLSGITLEDFNIAKKAVYGISISALDSTSSVANMLTEFHFSNKEIYSYITEVENATLEDLNLRLTEQFNVDNCALSVIKA